jgi:hypothetical protein
VYLAPRFRRRVLNVLLRLIWRSMGIFIRCSILLTFLVERPLDSEHLVITDYPEPFI